MPGSRPESSRRLPVEPDALDLHGVRMVGRLREEPGAEADVQGVEVLGVETVARTAAIGRTGPVGEVAESVPWYAHFLPVAGQRDDAPPRAAVGLEHHEFQGALCVLARADLEAQRPATDELALPGPQSLVELEAEAD